MTRLPAIVRVWIVLPIVLLTAHIAQAAKDDLGNGSRIVTLSIAC